ncbi:hypothetical protein BS47DRAFT_1489205 [Hydnum rufescens UP504]|uniref:Gpr1 family protein n=1 Tax=Hydnum rufescens UP504 TaxID=1448309 RepID=A0A9P6DPX3_9AGAM|nr:hypothetical protein BS47DRAFT_1489205 [Hydnum rufescens UP504]
MADVEKYAAPSPHLRKIANPAPLGLFSFASTTLILSLVNAQTRHVTEPNIVVGMALGCGGLAQLLAGMWEFVCGNTFGATAFSSYGAFWISYGIIFIPGSGILDAYSTTNPAVRAGDEANAVAFFLLAWFIFTFCILLASFRSNLTMVALFFFLDLTFMLLMIGAFKPEVNATKAGGGTGIVTAAIAYYAAASGLMTPQYSYFPFPTGELPKNA